MVCRVDHMGRPSSGLFRGTLARQSALRGTAWCSREHLALSVVGPRWTLPCVVYPLDCPSAISSLVYSLVAYGSPRLSSSRSRGGLGASDDHLDQEVSALRVVAHYKRDLRELWLCGG